MTSLTMLNVIMMVEIAALMSTQITVSILLIALVIIRKIVQLGSFPLQLEMESVMMRPTMLSVTLMMEIAAMTLFQIMQTAIMMVEIAVVLVL